MKMYIKITSCLSLLTLAFSLYSMDGQFSKSKLDNTVSSGANTTDASLDTKEKLFREACAFANAGEPQKARAVYEEAAKLGHVIAQCNLAALLLEDSKKAASQTECTQALNEAFRWFLLASQQGCLEAEHNLGIIYKEKSNETPDPSLKAALLDLAEKHLLRGMLETRGITHFSLGTVYEAKFFEWAIRAAKQGDCDCQVSLGVTFRTMSDGATFEKDALLRQAIYWFYKAVNQGHLDSTYALSILYDKKAKLHPDGFMRSHCLTKALQWSEKAATRGHVVAQYNTGYLYAEKILVTRDKEQRSMLFNKAHDWFQKAEQNGLEKATLAIDILKESYQF